MNPIYTGKLVRLHKKQLTVRVLPIRIPLLSFDTKINNSHCCWLWNYTELDRNTYSFLSVIQENGLFSEHSRKLCQNENQALF